MDRLFIKIDLCRSHDGQGSPAVSQQEIPRVEMFKGDAYGLTARGLYRMRQDTDNWVPIADAPVKSFDGFALVATTLGLVISGGNEVWLYDSEFWCPFYGTMRPRFNHATCFVPTKRAVVISGGYGPDDKALSDFLVLSLDTGEITEIPLSEPLERACHTVTWVRDDLVLMFGGLGPNSIFQTIPLFVDITTGHVTPREVAAAFPGVQNHTALMVDGRLFFTGGFTGGRKSFETWVLDLDYSLWLRLDLVPFHRTAWFLLPIDHGFRLFNDTLLQSVELRYESTSAFIEALVDSNLSSTVYDFDDAKADRELARVFTEEESLIRELASVDSRSPGIEKLCRLTEEIHETHGHILAVESYIQNTLSGPAPRAPAEPGETGACDEPAEALLSQLASLSPSAAEPADADPYKALDRLLHAAAAADRRGARGHRAELRSLCEANVDLIVRQRELIAQSRPRGAVEGCDLGSLLDGTERCDEITAGVCDLTRQLYDAQLRYAQLRVTVCQRRLAHYELSTGRQADGARAALERFAAIEAADRAAQALRALLAARGDHLRVVDAQYARLLARGQSGSANECELLAKNAMDALARLAEWADDAAVRTHSKRPPAIFSPQAADPAFGRSAPVATRSRLQERRATQAAFVVAFTDAPAQKTAKASVLAMRDTPQARWYDSTFAAIRAIGKDRKQK
jgi:hypothetical protein